MQATQTPYNGGAMGTAMSAPMGQQPVNRINVQSPPAQSGPATTLSSNAAAPTSIPASAGVGSTIQGVSTVNPQAKGNAFDSVDKYIDQSYNNALNRLQPQIDQGRDALTQSMIDRGIGVGSEAHNESMRTQGQVENDALQNAAFQAMGFGTNLQNQMFQQDNARSQLANSMAQAQMANRLGYSNLGEQARQFNDTSARAWDDNAFRDLNWMDAQNFRNRQYNDGRDDTYFNMRQALLGAIPGWNPAQIDVNGSAGAATNSQQAAYQAQNEQNQQMFNNVTALAGAAGGFMSDPALKQDIEQIGEVKGLGWYKWIWNETAKEVFGLEGESFGFMADEVPAEYRGERDGFMTVDYGRLLA